MINNNDIVSIKEHPTMFGGPKKHITREYFVLNVQNNKIYVEDMLNPLIRKTIDISQLLTINGMTVDRHAKVGL